MTRKHAEKHNVEDWPDDEEDDEADEVERLDGLQMVELIFYYFFWIFLESEQFRFCRKFTLFQINYKIFFFN